MLRHMIVIGWDVERAAEWIFTHPNEASAMDVDDDVETDANSSNAINQDIKQSFPDGNGGKEPSHVLFSSLINGKRGIDKVD